MPNLLLLPMFHQHIFLNQVLIKIHELLTQVLLNRLPTYFMSSLHTKRQKVKKSVDQFTACMNLLQICLQVKEICFFSHSVSICINDYQLDQQSENKILEFRNHKGYNLPQASNFKKLELTPALFRQIDSINEKMQQKQNNTGLQMICSTTKLH